MEGRVVESVHVLTPTQSLVAGQETDDLLSAAEEILAQEAPRIVVDLKKVDYMSATGLGVLVKVHVGCSKRGGWLRIIGMNKRIRSLLVGCWPPVLDIYETLEETIAAPTKARA